ncbi:hypothetical protein LTR50_005821 [Elasticomyces elasticus]|nr:hypothetical protein LTR50_005821 [Elasticomyces elasticus]
MGYAEKIKAAQAEENKRYIRDAENLSKEMAGRAVRNTDNKDDDNDKDEDPLAKRTRRALKTRGPREDDGLLSRWEQE